MRLLFVNACPRGAESRTLALAERLLSRVTALYPETQVIRHDLMDLKLCPFDAQMLEKRNALSDAHDWSHPLTCHAADLQSADAVFVAAPYWDLSFPAILKVWVEHMWVRELTFRYVDDLPVGLCAGRECVYITTSGSPIGENDWGAIYMKAVMTTLGIPSFSSLRAEALDIETTDVQKAMSDAFNRADRAAEAFVRRLKNA